ncbi:MAG: hypothetical protein FWD71_04520 [Oscillospiraceae bacterium]|nr:hypothetical protein [Oscillospiraceae bacterium]
MINISIEEANKKSLMEIIQLVEEKGTATVLKGGRRFIVLEDNEVDGEKYADDLSVQKTGEEFIQKYLKAFKELAK